MARATWSPSSSPSSTSSSSSTNSNFQTRSQNTNIPAKCLVEIPLVPPPTINYRNLTLLDNAEFVNIVFESNADNAFFRISDESNKEVCRIITYRNAEGQPEKNGVKYLECCDMLGNCLLYVAYPVGLGEVALLSPTEELIGECQSNVEFICLSVKVKYNFYDMNGNRLMKMTAIMPEEGSGDKFMLMVKRSKKEKLALIKMGSLKSCCHIKFKAGEVSVLERIQIIALWAGFMHNEIQDKEVPILLERHAQHKKEKESRRKKSFIANTLLNRDNRNCSNEINGDTTPVESSDPVRHNNNTITNNEVGDKKKDNMNTIAKVRFWKNLVTSHFSRNQHQDHDHNLGPHSTDNNNVKIVQDVNDDRNDVTNYRNGIPVCS